MWAKLKRVDWFRLVAAVAIGAGAAVLFVVAATEVLKP